MYRNRGVYPGNIQSPATPCGQKLFYELPVRVTVGGIEHAHDLVHQNDHASRVVVVGQQKRFGSEIRDDNTFQDRFLPVFSRGFPCFQFCLVHLEKGIVTFPDRAICGLQRWGLAQSGPAYQNDVQRSAALPVSFDADTVCASQGRGYSRQHGRRDKLDFVVLVCGHIEYDRLHGLGQDLQRESRSFNILRLHADSVTQFKPAGCHITHFFSCNRMLHSRTCCLSVPGVHRTWHTCSCYRP